MYSIKGLLILIYIIIFCLKIKTWDKFLEWVEKRTWWKSLAVNVLATEWVKLQPRALKSSDCIDIMTMSWIRMNFPLVG